MLTIESLSAVEVLDSRGRPTLTVSIELRGRSLRVQASRRARQREHGRPTSSETRIRPDTAARASGALSAMSAGKSMRG